MNLTKEQVKKIIEKVHLDLDLDYSSKYPIIANYTENHKDFKIDIWGGGYDYRDPEAVGDNGWGIYTEWVIIIDDKKEEAVMYGYYTGRFLIKLNENGKYEHVKRVGINKK